MNEELLKLIREFKGTIQFRWAEDQQAYNVRLVRNSYRCDLWIARRTLEQSALDDLLTHEIRKAIAFVKRKIEAPAGVVESVNADGTARVRLDSPNETWRDRPAML
jgi:hypothetical protein